MTRSYPFGDLTLTFSEHGLIDVAAAGVSAGSGAWGLGNPDLWDTGWIMPWLLPTMGPAVADVVRQYIGGDGSWQL
jgi:hypothetical protein